MFRDARVSFSNSATATCFPQIPSGGKNRIGEKIPFPIGGTFPERLRERKQRSLGPPAAHRLAWRGSPGAAATKAAGGTALSALLRNGMLWNARTQLLHVLAATRVKTTQLS